MQIMLTDETNKSPSSDAKFFVYGGLIFPIDQLSQIHNEVEFIRKEAGYEPEDEFKFDTHSRPSYVSIGDATKAKNRVIDLCSNLGCKFITHIILHEIIKGQDPNHQIQWAADYVISRYNKYLEEEVKDDGICIVDNLPNGTEFSYLTNKFRHGLTLHDGSFVRLNMIKLFGSTRIGASHANSVMDIVLGSFRYVINNPRNVEAAREMFKKVSQMMWAIEKDDIRYVRDRGLIIRPPLEKIEVKKYRDDYQQLIAFLTDLANK